MIKKKIRVFTEEYRINVFIGTRDEIVSAAARYLKAQKKDIARQFGSCRGFAWNCLAFEENKRQPLIIVDGDLPEHIALATLAHEASHAMDYIASHISLNDRSGEFHAHGIAAVMRGCGKYIFKK